MSLRWLVHLEVCTETDDWGSEVGLASEAVVCWVGLRILESFSCLKGYCKDEIFKCLLCYSNKSNIF